MYDVLGFMALWFVAFTVYDLWCMVYCVLFIVYGVWFMFMVYGVWSMLGFTVGFRVQGFRV